MLRALVIDLVIPSDLNGKLNWATCRLGIFMVWLQFLICGAVVLLAGSRLSHYAELIAKKSGFGKNWVALVLLAVIASSSQLIASVSAVVLHDLPDMAIGALMGSSMFNMLVIGLLDLFSRNKPVSNMVQQSHVLSLGFSIVLLGIATIDILFGRGLPALRAVNSMDPITVGLVPIYLIALWMTFRFEAKSLQFDERDTSANIGEKQPSWLQLTVPFIVCAVLIVGASGYLPYLAECVQKQTGWGQSFIGLSFIAVITCLPEVAVSTSAARRGSFDVAIGSLLGSNLFYMVVLAITDFCYLKGPVLREVSSINALAAMTAIVSMAIVIIALTYRSERKFLFLAGDAAALICVYLLANFLLYTSH